MAVKNEFIESILCDCVTELNCPLGAFYPDKNYGSKIKNSIMLNNEKLLAYARQAVAMIDGVYIKSVETNTKNALFEIMINDEKRQVCIEI